MAAAALGLAWMGGAYLVLLGEPGLHLHLPLLILGMLALPAAVAAWPSARLRLALLGLACLCLSGARTLGVEGSRWDDPLSGLEGQVELVGTVAGPPRLYGERANVVMDVQARLAEHRWSDQAGRVWFQTWEGPRLTYGDVVQVRGRLAEPHVRPGSSLPSLLRRQGVRYLVERPEVRLVEGGRGDPFWAGLDAARQTIDAAVTRHLPQPHASLLGGMLVGMRAHIPPEVRQGLIASGTSHLVAVSGFHVAIVAGLVTLLLVSTLGRRHALLPALLAIGLYALLTGPQPSALRAALMASVALLAMSLGRLPDPLTSLVLVGAAMLAVDPLQGLDAGFQLSFAATAGIILLQPGLARRLEPLPRWMREPLAVTLAAQVATLPIIVSTFHTLSLVSPLSNLLLAPALPPLMVLGLLLVLASPVPALGALLAWPCWALLAYVLSVIRLSSAPPEAFLTVGALPPALVAGLYLLVLGLGLLALPEVRALLARVAPPAGWGRPVAAVLLASLIALLPLTALATRPDGRLHLQTLDLGDRLAVLVRTPSGRTALMTDAAAPGGLIVALTRQLRPWERRLSVVLVPGEAEAARLRPLFARYPSQVVILSTSTTHPGQAEWLDIPAGTRLELDRDVWLEPASDHASNEARARGWLLRHGGVQVAIGRAPDPSDEVHALMLTRSAGLGENADSSARDGPGLVVAPGSGDRQTTERWRGSLVLATDVHGEPDLVSDGSELLVRSAHCLPPLQPPSCVLVVERP